MPIIVNQISSPLNASEQEVISAALKKLGSASKHAIDCEIHKALLMHESATTFTLSTQFS